jgi:hypothetical protein
MMTRITVRRSIYWLFLVIGIISALLTYSPIGSYLAGHGVFLGGRAYLHVAVGVALAVLLIWCAVCVRTEPVLVRLMLLVVGIPLFISTVAELLHLIVYTLHGSPVIEGW